MIKVLLPFLLCTANPGVSTGASFVASPLAISGSSSSSSPSSSASVHHRHSSNSGCRPAAAASSSSTPPFVSSDLKSLLPTPKKRTLRLDKFGRRVHDLTDDGTAKYNMKGEGGGTTSRRRMPPGRRAPRRWRRRRRAPTSTCPHRQRRRAPT